MRFIFIFLSPCLLLVCCEKPSEKDSHKGVAAPATRIASGGHALREPVSDSFAAPDGDAPREQAPDTPQALRMMLQAALRIEFPSAREKALADVAWNAIELDPQLACEAFLQLPAGSTEKIRLIQHYAMRLAEQDPDEALAWANTLTTEEERAAANCQIALAIAETDPLRAANMLSESGINGRDFDVAVVQVIQRWAARAPVDAGAWVSSFPPGAAQQAGVKIIVEQWMPRDAPAAFDWLDSMKDEKLRQETARAMEGVILQQPKDIGNEWLQHADSRIQSELEQQREQAIKDVGDNIPSLTK